MSNIQKPIALYPNPPLSSPPCGSDWEGNLWYFPPICIRNSRSPSQGRFPFPLAQPCLKHHNPDGFESRNKSLLQPPATKHQATTSKRRIKAMKGKSGPLGDKNVVNTTGGDSPLSEPSTSKRKAPSNNELDGKSPVKRRCLTFIDEDDLKWVKREIRGIKLAMQQITDKWEEDKRGIDDKLDEIFHKIQQLSCPA